MIYSTLRFLSFSLIITAMSICSIAKAQSETAQLLDDYMGTENCLMTSTEKVFTILTSKKEKIVGIYKEKNNAYHLLAELNGSTTENADFTIEGGLYWVKYAEIGQVLPIFLSKEEAHTQRESSLCLQATSTQLGAITSNSSANVNGAQALPTIGECVLILMILSLVTVAMTSIYAAQRSRKVVS